MLIGRYLHNGGLCTSMKWAQIFLPPDWINENFPRLFYTVERWFRLNNNSRWARWKKGICLTRFNLLLFPKKSSFVFPILGLFAGEKIRVCKLYLFLQGRSSALIFSWISLLLVVRVVIPASLMLMIYLIQIQRLSSQLELHMNIWAKSCLGLYARNKTVVFFSSPSSYNV